MLTGRIGKWIPALSEFNFQYVPQRVIKGQAIADFCPSTKNPRKSLLTSQELWKWSAFGFHLVRITWERNSGFGKK
ncbi:hypothetical protein ACFXTH_022944 [Malus domestica]